MKFLYLVWANLKRKKVRTLLTIASIFIAFVLFGLLGAVDAAMSMGVDLAGADRLLVRHKVSLIQLLPQSYEARMEQIDGVTDATHQTWFGGIYQDPKNFFAQTPVKPDEFMAMYPEYLLDDESMALWKATKTGAVVGRAIADQYEWEVGDKVPIQATIWGQKDGSRTWTFDVVGIYEGAEKGTDTTQFLFRYDYFDEARAGAEGQVGWYMIRIGEPDRAAEIAAAVDDTFANSPAETRTETEKAFIQGFANQAGNIGKILIGVLGAVFFTILLTAGNTMAQAVRERTVELGVLKAIGFSENKVLALTLAESCLVAVLGGGLGLVTGWFLVTGMRDAVQKMLPIFYLPPERLVVGAVLVLLLGVVTGILPALQASRLKVADALRKG